MKELSIEEKAKRYDEAIKKAESLYKASEPMSGCNVIVETLFPELKESEDERIRIELLNYLYDVHDDDEERARWIAYLEKQGEHANFRNKIQIGDKVTRNRDGVLVNLSQLNRVAKKDEKQGEQKPADVDYNPFDDFRKSDSEINPSEFDARLNTLLKEFESLPKEELVNSLAFYLNVVQNDGTYNEQKPADKDEPKFNIGDLITNGIIIGKVDENDNNKYHGWFGYDKDLSVHYADIPDVENWHLWTIQDAKDGDVLTCENGWTCIFKTLANDETFSSYCFMDNTEWFCETGSECHTLNKAYNGEIKPATKEQRDLLFQKMKEAGYMWNAEKKELKKIEQKTAWSEEDDIMVNDIDYALRCQITYPISKLQSMSNWIDNLKSRVQPQPKQEWSEEDENMLTDTEYLMRVVKMENRSNNEYQRVENCINWLKSLRPQPQWKPSGEQLHYLSWIANIKLGDGVVEQEVSKHLNELLEDLKKLKS